MYLSTCLSICLSSTCVFVTLGIELRACTEQYHTALLFIFLKICFEMALTYSVWPGTCDPPALATELQACTSVPVSVPVSVG